MFGFGKFLHCCAVGGDEGTEYKVVQLSSDVMEAEIAPPVHLLTSQDPYQIAMSSKHGKDSLSRLVTPRQKNFRDRLTLPNLRKYPVPPGCSEDEPEEWRRDKLLALFKEFVIELKEGQQMTQLTSNQDHSDIHCQILEDLQTLQLDHGSGNIIEFPLTAVSKVYRIIKNDDKWYSAGGLSGAQPMPPLPLSNAEHIVVVEFMRRKLAFVFPDIQAAQRYLLCMELLIRRAQESKHEADSSVKKKPGQAISPMFSSASLKGGDDGCGWRVNEHPHSKNAPRLLCDWQPEV